MFQALICFPNFSRPGTLVSLLPGLCWRPVHVYLLLGFIALCQGLWRQGSKWETMKDTTFNLLKRAGTGSGHRGQKGNQVRYRQGQKSGYQGRGGREPEQAGSSDSAAGFHCS